MTPFSSGSHLNFCNIKLTFRDKYQPRYIQIIRIFTTRSTQQTALTLVSRLLLLQRTFIEEL